MNKRKKIILGLVILLLLLPAIDFFLRRSVASWRWSQAVSAAGSMPFQIGLTNVTMIKCFTSAPPPKCNGGDLCNTVDFATCSNYWEVTGASAGGTGQPPLLLSQIAVGQAGLMVRGQLIYGNTTNSMFLSPSAVLASVGGCSGCGMGKADSNVMDRIADVASYIIAGFRDKIK